MESIEIVKSGIFLPERKVESEYIENELNLDEGYIKKRTGIKQRFFAFDEGIEEMAWFAVQDMDLSNDEKESIGMIITATTTTDNLMPGISNYVQKMLNIDRCICLDILAACSGFINAFDIASLYIRSGRVDKALVIGVDVLSRFTDPDDINTLIILSDGAGATLIGKSDLDEMYYSCINCEGKNNHILTCKSGAKIHMEGKDVYKYAVTRTVDNVKELLDKAKVNIEDIDYIIPHQSNMKIIKAIASRLNFDEEKMYINIQNVGNTFCASIPIAIKEGMENGIIKRGNKIILLGYGGGLNTGSILIKV